MEAGRHESLSSRGGVGTLDSYTIIFLLMPMTRQAICLLTGAWAAPRYHWCVSSCGLAIFPFLILVGLRALCWSITAWRWRQHSLSTGRGHMSSASALLSKIPLYSCSVFTDTDLVPKS